MNLAELEACVQAAWRDLLGRDAVEASDDFLDLGGDSWLAVKLLARIREDTGASVDLPEFFDRPTFSGLISLTKASAVRGDESQACTITERFRKTATALPEAVAVRGHDVNLVYRDLYCEAQRIAAFLRLRGVGRGDRVGILLEPGAAVPAAILGVLLAGAAYVPLQPSMSPADMKLVADDAHLRCVVFQKLHVRTLNRLQWECASLQDAICIDSEAIHQETESESSPFMDEELWEYIGSNAADDIGGGGWKSSYTGNAFSREEMEEFRDNAVAKVVPYLDQTKRVLDIGCASGITMFALAPHVGYYHGIDLSGVIVERNRAFARARGLDRVRVSRLAAHELDALDDGPFDAIIMNSVVQCFPGHAYLRKVIDGAVARLADRGILFIGDVMDLERRDSLVRSLLDFERSQPPSRRGVVKTDWDTELFLSRAFFQDLAADRAVIRRVDFSAKLGAHANELTRFRYDVILQVDKNAHHEQTIHRKTKQQFDRTSLPLSGNGTEDATQPDDPACVFYAMGGAGESRATIMSHAAITNLAAEEARAHLANPPVTRPLRSVEDFALAPESVCIPLLTGGCIEVQ